MTPATKHKPVSKAAWKARQRLMNEWVERYDLLEDVKPVVVDGDPGPATRKRIRQIKWWMGYTKKHNRTSAYTLNFEHQLRHPNWKRYREVNKRGRSHRKQHHKWWLHSQSAVDSDGDGLAMFEGTVVAAWWVPKLQWAREHGWTGHLNSGYRSPEHSQALCFEICGQPSCPGRCAGTTSNHTKKDKAHAAVDVSDYVTFGRLMRVCPIGPRCFNALPIDPVHFSPTGR